jgi:hypothetical protein
MKGRDRLGNLGVDGRIILKWILKEYESVHWIHLAQDRNQWRAPVNTVMSRWVP